MTKPSHLMFQFNLISLFGCDELLLLLLAVKHFSTTVFIFPLICSLNEMKNIGQQGLYDDKTAYTV